MEGVGVRVGAQLGPGVQERGGEWVTEGGLASLRGHLRAPRVTKGQALLPLSCPLLCGAVATEPPRVTRQEQSCPSPGG